MPLVAKAVDVPAGPTASQGRARYAVAAFIVQILLGIIYSWSIFRDPLAQLHGWSKSQTIAPYRYSILMFAAGVIIGGFWQDRKGPRLVASVGGFFLGTGFLLASRIGDTVGGLIVAFGLVAGFGLGLAYVTPIATCIKWFPDKRGTIVGLAIMGFGTGPLLFGPLVEQLIGNDPSRLAETIPRTFAILAGLFYVGLIGTAQFYRVPPPGWSPPNWTPKHDHQHARDFTPRQALGRWQFYGLWFLYALGTSVGLTAIGQAAPLLSDIAGTAAVMSTGMALGVMSLFNGLGRLGWGAFSDRFGRRAAGMAMGALSLLVCLAMAGGATRFSSLLAGLCVIAFAYGGYGALVISLVADYFGSRNVGSNFGMLFTAWGTCGFLVPGYFEAMLDHARATGHLAGGYQQVYGRLALLAFTAIVISVILRPPKLKI